MADKKIAVILEAAGSSTRFGSNKLLHIMEDGRPMISGVLDAVRGASSASSGSEVTAGVPVIRRILVTQYDKVAALAPDFTVVMNHHPELGISHSMQLGIEAAGDADAYMFCVCDQPGISASTIRKLIDTYYSASDDSHDAPARIVSLAWQERMYNPKIFSAGFREELMALSGDTGGRQIIADHKDALLLVEAESEDEVLDIDTPI